MRGDTDPSLRVAIQDVRANPTVDQRTQLFRDEYFADRQTAAVEIRDRSIENVMQRLENVVHAIEIANMGDELPGITVHFSEPVYGADHISKKTLERTLTFDLDELVPFYKDLTNYWKKHAHDPSYYPFIQFVELNFKNGVIDNESKNTLSDDANNDTIVSVNSFETIVKEEAIDNIRALTQSMKDVAFIPYDLTYFENKTVSGSFVDTLVTVNMCMKDDAGREIYEQKTVQIQNLKKEIDSTYKYFPYVRIELVAVKRDSVLQKNKEYAIQLNEKEIKRETYSIQVDLEKLLDTVYEDGFIGDDIAAIEPRDWRLYMEEVFAVIFRLQSELHERLTKVILDDMVFPSDPFDENKLFEQLKEIIKKLFYEFD